MAPRRTWETLPRFAREGAIAGVVAAALSGAPSTLHAVGRRFPAIRALPFLPQVADHVLFGITVGAILKLRRATGTPAFDSAAASLG